MRIVRNVTVPSASAGADEVSKSPKTALTMKVKPAEIAKNVALMIATSIASPRERVTNPALSDGSVRGGLRARRRAILSTAASSPLAMRRTCRPRSAIRPTPWEAIALRISGASAIRSISFCTSSLESSWSQTLSTSFESMASVSARSNSGLASTPRIALSVAGPWSTLISARSTASLSSALTIASSVATWTVLSIPVASATARAPRAPPPKSLVANEGRGLGGSAMQGQCRSRVGRIEAE